jgi:hypothetical protein
VPPGSVRALPAMRPTQPNDPAGGELGIPLVIAAWWAGDLGDQLGSRRSPAPAPTVPSGEASTSAPAARRSRRDCFQALKQAFTIGESAGTPLGPAPPLRRHLEIARRRRAGGGARRARGTISTPITVEEKPGAALCSQAGSAAGTATYSRVEDLVGRTMGGWERDVEAQSIRQSLIHAVGVTGAGFGAVITRSAGGEPNAERTIDPHRQR